MSKISDAYAEIKGDVEGLFSGIIELANVFQVEENTDGAKTNGWGLKFNPGTNTNRKVGCDLSIGREMVIILTSRTYSNEIDASTVAAANLALLERQFSLIAFYEEDPELADSGVFRFTYATDNGVQNIVEGSSQYIKIETVFQMEYFEKLT